MKVDLLLLLQVSYVRSVIVVSDESKAQPNNVYIDLL